MSWSIGGGSEGGRRRRRGGNCLQTRSGEKRRKDRRRELSTVLVQYCTTTVALLWPWWRREEGRHRRQSLSLSLSRRRVSLHSFLEATKLRTPPTPILVLLLLWGKKPRYGFCRKYHTKAILICFKKAGEELHCKKMIFLLSISSPPPTPIPPLPPSR